MPQIIKFGNPGRIDPRVWSTFGVSVKESENAIGQFGTGLKYAIATLLRNKRKFWIEVKEEDDEVTIYNFSVRTEMIRGKEFGVIYCNDTQLPFTTDLGPGWELWHAYRELYSNCLDEDGEFGEGETTIVAELGDIEHESVFLKKELRNLADSDWGLEIYEGPSKVVYMRGIKVYDLPKESAFTYNLLAASLTEDRTLKSLHSLEEAIERVLFKTESESVMRRYLFGTKDHYEESFTFNSSFYSPEDSLLNFVKENSRVDLWMQNGLTGKVKRCLPAEPPKTEPLDEIQRRATDKALELLRKMGFTVDYPIYFAPDLRGSVLARAVRVPEEIHLSERIFTMGIKQVAAAILEEHFHIRHNLEDLTYDMQNFLFDCIMTLGERVIDEVI